METKISNTKQEVESTVNMTDKDYANKLLSCLKEMIKNYAVALTEASNEILYNKYKDMFIRYSMMQRNLFEAMFRKGWYELEKIDTNKLNEKYNMLNKDFDSIRTS